MKLIETSAPPERQRSRSFDVALAACGLLVAAALGLQ
jgi:hypothetical protein